MNNNELQIQTKRNSWLSILLMGIILVMVYVFLHCTYTSENEEMYNVLYLSASGTISLGSYAFYYKGRTYIVAKILFFLSLLISLLIFVGIKYLEAFGKGFNH